MSTADSARFQELSRRLRDELDTASPGLRSTSEWRDARAAMDGVAASPPADEDAEALDDSVRLLGAQLDLLALARERTEVEEARQARAREERLREDKQIVETIRDEMQVYGWLVLASFLLAPALGIPWGGVVIFALAPALYGTTRMMRAKRPAAGRTWVILQGEVDELLSRVRFYEVAAALAIATPILWIAIRSLVVD